MISFKKQAIYTTGLLNNSMTLTVDIRIPRTNMHNGVVILPNIEIALSKADGKLILNIYIGKEKDIASVVGLMIADLREMYFLFFVSMNTPRVNARRFILITYTDE